VILVDDGIATGATMKAAIQSVAAHKPKEIIVAAPVAPPSTLSEFAGMASKVICLHTAEDFQAVGQFYRYFDQTTDTEVISLLEDADKKQRLYFRRLERQANRTAANKK
jgi:predicted phosphoribosyltransferase